MPDPAEVQDWIRSAAAKAGIPPELALAVAEQESSFDINAIGKIPADAQGTRAIGTFQLLPKTAQDLGVDPHDPLQNIRGGTMYLRKLIDDNHGDLNKALAAYGGVKTNTTYVPGVLGKIPKWRQAAGTAAAPTVAQPPPAPPQVAKTGLRVGIEGFNDLAMGALKGAGQTATNLGELVHKIPGVTQGVDALWDTVYGDQGGTPDAAPAFAEANRALEPSNTTQSVGKFGEQVAELVIPSRAASAAGVKAASLFGSGAGKLAARAAVEGAAGAGMSAAQGGDPLTGGVLSAAIPVVGATAGKAAKYLKGSAEKKVAQALGASKEKYKAITKRITPEILKRGLGGSREGLIEQASGMLDETSAELTKLSQQYGPDRIGTKKVIAVLEAAKDEFRTTKIPWGGQQAGRTPKVVEYEPRAIRQLERLQDILRKLGRSATVQQITGIRQAWDDVVARAGGFAHRAEGAIGVPLAEQTEAWAKREGTSAIRAKLAKHYPDLADINKEWSFWMNLKDVLTQTVNRTAPQGPGLGQQLAVSGATLAGAAIGAGGGPLAMIGGAAGARTVMKYFNKVITSPRWRFASAQVRHQLAEALMNNDVNELIRLAGQVGAVQASKLAKPPPEPPGKETPLRLRIP